MTSVETGAGAGWPVVLASASTTRAALLRRAGVAAEALAAGVDEGGMKRSLQAEQAPPRDIAQGLAELKAVRVSLRRQQCLVIGADQVLVCNGVLFDKPADMEHARAALKALSGRRHELISAVAVALDGTCIWRHIDSARLTMRPLSDAFIDWYLGEVGEAALSSVGAYQLEGLGAQLFSRVDGDFFTVLGLPLLPLLDFLRGHGAVRT